MILDPSLAAIHHRPTVEQLKNKRFDLARNRFAREKNRSNKEATRLLLKRRNRRAVTTNHLLLRSQRRKTAALLPITQPNSDFLGSECNGRADGGGGGQPDAVAESPVSISSHEILFQMAPYPTLLLSKKRASQPPRNSDPVPGRGFHMNSLPFIDDLGGFAPSAILIGEGQPADRIWTREQFLLLCGYMRNNNPADEFLRVYRDSDGVSRFVKSKSAKVEQMITWAWDSITGRAKHKVSVGFYPWNRWSASRWAAIDFDAHDGGAARAKELAVAAFQILYRCPQLSLILATSGSEGWHLFVFSAAFQPVGAWVRLLKRVVDKIGAKIETGVCEIFPNETRNGSRPHAIRAPGTWNPKTNQLGAIIFTSIAPLLQMKRKKEVSSFLYHSTDGANVSQLNDSGSRSLYCGGYQNWLEQFAITQAGTRHGQLRALVYCIFRQVSHRAARRIADTHYRAARVQPKATLAEHLEEFEALWNWMTNQWRAELSDVERKTFALLGSEIERDLFRILMNFAHYARSQKLKDFPFPLQHVADRLGVSFQHVGKLRRRLLDNSIIAQTEPAVTNRSAGRFRWCLPAS
jgi:hypothetical protein